ncbi:histone-lysine N-methyltransferase eggless [Atheta coriaria]|uniref:histone-lysine N-methyltransferase eggless n=1 Tax=Dalotia coriaria TaxID=877792 RepID=UPI0031F3A0DE
MSELQQEENIADAKKPNEVIVLDDDEMDVDNAEKTKRNCINYYCKSGFDPVEPPAYCLTYYQIKGKAKGQKVCQACYDIATNHFFDISKAIEQGKSLLTLDYPDFCEVVALDSDEEEGYEDKNLDEKAISYLEEHFAEVMEESMIKYDVENTMKRTLDEIKTKVKESNESTVQLQNDIKDVRKQFDQILYSLTNAMRPHQSELSELILDIPQMETEETEDDVETVNVQTIHPPIDLPMRGTAVKPPLIIGEFYYSRRTDLTSWMKVRLENIIPPGSKINDIHIRTYMYQVVRDLGSREQRRFVEGRNIAYSETLPILLEIGTRVIALFDESNSVPHSNRLKVYYPGIVGEFPCAFNKYRYLIFFDDGYALYVHHREVFMIYESSKDVWEDVYQESRPFIKKYLTEYPNRSMVKFLKYQKVRTEYKGKWFETTVKEVDCSLVQMYFSSLKRTEWIYRGSRRLKTMYQEEQAANNRQNLKHKYPRARNRLSNLTGAPYVEYSSVCDDNDVVFISQEPVGKPGSRAVAKKSTRPSSSSTGHAHSRPPVQHERPPPGKIVYYTPRKPYSFYLYEPHNCKAACLKQITPLNRLKGYGPLAKPLLCGFYRMLYKAKHRRPFILYKTPCGRTTRNMEELHKYLRITNSELTVDLFDFDPAVRCLAEFILEPDACLNKDLSEGLEQVQLPVVNYVDNKVCDFVNYSTQRTPSEGVNLNLDPEFLTCCDCTDDCWDKSKCACWKLTQEGAKFLHKAPEDVGYVYRRLLNPLLTGIYECNSRCRCRKTCLNRVVQNPLQHKLQVFLTSNNRGWGIRCLNDIPRGSFICIYAGCLLTDQMANEGGQTCGDEYYAELDFIEIVEMAKDDYEADAYESDEGGEEKTPQVTETKKTAKKTEEKSEQNNTTVPESTTPATTPGAGAEQPASSVHEEGSIRSRLRKRDVEINYKKLGEDSFNNSDEEADEQPTTREPGGFNPDGDMQAPTSKYPSVRTLFGKDENVYIMDAKSTGNLGRFLNHSCSPNVFVQNVFVDTHDLRFPWVSFFAMQFIRAGTELTWNYNYDVGSVEDKVLYCNCGSSECKGRLL